MPCQHCDLSKDEHGMFTDHKYEEAHEDHDEEFEEAFSMERYKILSRAGLKTFPLPFTLWLTDKQKCLDEIIELFE